MKKPVDRSMEELIERSSLGSAEARRRRGRVSPGIGRALARAAAARRSAGPKKSARPSQG